MISGLMLRAPVSGPQRLLVIALLICDALFPLTGRAGGGQSTINFSVSGNIIRPSCNVEAPNVVKLGTFNRQELSIPGANSASIPVQIKLTGCTGGLSEATATFSGQPYDNGAMGTAIYANQYENGATGIGLQLISADGKPLVNLANGVSYSVPVDADTHSGNLRMIARMYSPEGKPGAGDFSSSVTINFVYQ
ncbi:fimbrial protein [Cronobacter turicensis]|uniref:fimbrial protein n=1 Tax=Cronobacter turicensis TaxID=413502 RepID=UPI0035713698